MGSFRPQKSPGSDRFLGLLSSSPPPSSSSSAASASLELDEDDIFSTDTGPSPSPRPSPSINTIHHLSPLNPSPNPSPSGSPLSSFHRERNFGILAALPEDSKARNPKFLQRKPSISSASSSASTSPASSARIIPVIPKPKPAEYGGKADHHLYQSAPVNVPVIPGRLRGDPVERDEADDEDEDEMMLPPHEIVDRAQGKEEPLTTFSVLEGVGRTLKGRDLRRVRNAVWRKTGITVAVACKHEKNQATTVTNDKGYFEAEIPTSSPDCFARLIGAPEQLCSYKKFMMSRVVKEKGSDYTLSNPLTFLSSCPSSKAEDMKNEKPKKGSEFGSSKTIDLPLPREWGLAPSSYFLPVLPIIGIP